MRKVFALFILLSLLIPQHRILAKEDTMYYNEEYKYSISFPEHWYIFSEEMKQTLSSDEQIDSPAMFARDNGSQMFIRHLKPDNERYKLYKNLVDYVQKTPNKKQKIYRQINPISTELGRKIENYSIDELNETVELQTIKSSPAFKNIYITVFWKEFKGTLIEFEFYNFDNNKQLFQEASQINSSFMISPEALKSNMEEGSLNFLNIKTVSNYVDETSLFSPIIDFISLPVVWITFTSLIVFGLILLLLYRLS